MRTHRSPLRKPALVLGVAASALICIFAALVALYAVVPPVSTLMIAGRIKGKSDERIYVSLDKISPAAVAAVVASEDAGFCRNDGVDWGALKQALNRAGARGPRRGASTITMQTAKNLFLWPGRSAIRKSIEIGMALALGKVWSKRRTLEVYLNVAEWGDGIFGIEAASRRYFHKSANELDAGEGALLATSLPNPIRRNAAHPASYQRRLARGVEARARANPELLNCLAPTSATATLTQPLLPIASPSARPNQPQNQQKDGRPDSGVDDQTFDAADEMNAEARQQPIAEQGADNADGGVAD